MAHGIGRLGARGAALLAAAAALAGCATTGMAADRGHPDFSGFYNLARADKAHDPELMALVPEGTTDMLDTGAAEFPRDEYGGLILTPYARQVADAWDPLDDFTLSRACEPPSIAYSMQGPFPIEIIQTDKLIVIRMEYFDVTRFVFMDRDEHLPEDAPHSKAGDSIGHFEGDLLVVDTDHLEPSTLTNNGLYHSENMHVIERFKLIDDGRTLIASQEYEDPEMFTNRGVRYITWTKQDDYIYPYECDPTFALEYIAAKEREEAERAAAGD